MVTRGHTLYDMVKRWLDIVVSIIALVISAPIFITAAILIKLDGGPVFFKQIRVGRHGKCFEMLKFRSMVPNAHELEDELRQEHEENGGYGVTSTYKDPRITRIGSILRITNLDELPQFINILRGDMSFVGPRPVPYEESFLYGDRREYVLSVRPGLTGYWQIKRRMDMDYVERISLDSRYVKKHCLTLDAYIVLMTPISMLTSDYNSVSKPLPPKADEVLIPERARIPAGVSAHTKREESLEDAVA